MDPGFFWGEGGKNFLRWIFFFRFLLLGLNVCSSWRGFFCVFGQIRPILTKKKKVGGGVCFFSMTKNLNFICFYLIDFTLGKFTQKKRGFRSLSVTVSVFCLSLRSLSFLFFCSFFLHFFDLFSPSLFPTSFFLLAR